jgi:hypothetical protein
MSRSTLFALAVLAAIPGTVLAQTPKQPKVQPGPSEPDWVVILDTMYDLKMFDDLVNPIVTTAEATPGLFKKAGPGPVTFRPVIALGLDAVIRGGWYTIEDGATAPKTRELWHYQAKNTAKDIETGSNLPPRLAEGTTTVFDPGASPFGLWIGNDQFKDRVFSQPKQVAAHNPRLAKQPYKAMIYPFKDKKTGQIVPHSYLIGWEYSTNDDFQDVVCRIDNVDLVDEAGAPVKGK